MSRYDTEVNIPKRSALKCIFEKDDVPGRHLVLYVHKVEKGKIRSRNSTLDFSLYLSDGWYQIRAKLDHPLQEFVKLKRISLGQKLHICGASVNCPKQYNIFRLSGN